MIKVSSLHNDKFVINADLIELIEMTPDTIISLTTGKKIIVQESVDEIIHKVIEFRRTINPIKIDRTKAIS